MRNLRILSAAVFGLTAMVAGCGGGSSESMHTESTHSESHQGAGGMNHGSGGMAMADMCPMQVPGTTVAAADVDGGIELIFATSGDVSELRRRVTHMAEMHNQEHASGGMMMPAATASAEDAAGGARMILRPADPAQLDALREHARTHAEKMTRGECPMMAEGGEGGGMDGMHSQATSPPAR